MGITALQMFTLGCTNLVVSVDHKPLLGIFNNRELDSIKNPRLQNFKESCVPWTFEITYNPGKWHQGPDVMSRNPSSVKKEPLPGIYQVILNYIDTIPHVNPDLAFQILYSNCCSRRHRLFQTKISHHPWVPDKQAFAQSCVTVLLGHIVKLSYSYRLVQA